MEKTPLGWTGFPERHELPKVSLEVGKLYRLKFGNGTQAFYVTKITPAGKPFGLRLFNFSLVTGKGPYASWRPASIAVDDWRVMDEIRLPLGAPPLPTLPAKKSKAELATLKKAADAAYKALHESPWIRGEHGGGWKDPALCKAHTEAKVAYDTARAWSEIQ